MVLRPHASSEISGGEEVSVGERMIRLYVSCIFNSNYYISVRLFPFLLFLSGAVCSCISRQRRPIIYRELRSGKTSHWRHDRHIVGLEKKKGCFLRWTGHNAVDWLKWLGRQLPSPQTHPILMKKFDPWNTHSIDKSTNNFQSPSSWGAERTWGQACPVYHNILIHLTRSSLC